MDARTPYYEEHKKLGARFMSFSGWEMPIQFQGILAEHRAVRSSAGLFDISHMSQIWVTGQDAASYLQKLVTAEIEALLPGKSAYALLCREDGGVLDDLFVYRLAEDLFLVIANAGHADADLDWMQQHAANFRVQVRLQSPAAGLALQGPEAAHILEAAFPAAAELPRHGVGSFRSLSSTSSGIVIGRTGYTGEDGFELFAPAGALRDDYLRLLKQGASTGLVPCGLGARDTLRLEMGYRLYGNDLDDSHTALEAGLGWVVQFSKPSFIGRETLFREKTAGSRRRFIAFRVLEAGVPRHGSPIFFGDSQIGEASSATFSPSLQVGIGMGYVDALAYPKSAEGDPPLTIGIHGRRVRAERVTLPFYRGQESPRKS